MLDKIFMQILDMSITGSVVIAVVLAARLLLKKFPKVISYGLWFAVLFRLLCPVSIETEVSVVPEITPVEDTYELADVPISFADAGIAAYQAVGDALNGGIDMQRVPTTNFNEQGNVEYVSADWGDIWVLFGKYVWVAGVATMAIYSVLSYWKLKKQLAVQVKLLDNIYIADGIATPFVIGFIRPKIFLPGTLGEKEQAYIIAHEQYHIRRFDHIIKMLAFLALALHWFNPLVWLAFLLASRDMEMSCDEAVIRKFGPEVRAEYSASLLTLATGKRVVSGIPLAFGEGDPKGRIRNLAKWKKPVLWITAVAAVLCVVLVICLLTDPTGEEEPNQGTEPTVATTVPQQTQQTEATVPTTELQSTYPPETTVPVITGPGSDIDFRMIALETKYPFIFDSNDQWIREYLSQYDYVDVSQLKHGGFYVLDFKTNEIRTLFGEGTQFLRETPNTAFFVMNGEKLMRTDYYAEKVETIYEAQFGTIIGAERFNEFMCLVEAGRVICLNLLTYEIENVYLCEGAVGAFLHTPTQLIWRTEDWQYYLIDRTAGTQRRISEVEVDMLISGLKLSDTVTKPIDYAMPDGIPGVVTYAQKLEELSQNYTPQQAAADGCVVMIDGDVWANEDIWIAYTVADSRGENVKVRLADYDGTGKFKRLYELVSIKQGYLYRLLDKGSVVVHHYRWLGIDGDGDCDGDTYNMFKVYALTNEPMWKIIKGVPYDDSTWEGGSVMVFCNLYQRYDYAPIPHHLQSAELKNQSGTVAVIWDRNKLEKLMELLAPAEGYPDWPKTVVEGATLVLTGADGTKVEAMMMANSTMIEIDGVFYNYDPGWKEIYTVEDVLSLFGLSEMP